MSEHSTLKTATAMHGTIADLGKVNQKCMLIAFDAGSISLYFMDVYPRFSGFVFFFYIKSVC